jgi:hypothetical protein
MTLGSTARFTHGSTRANIRAQGLAIRRQVEVNYPLMARGAATSSLIPPASRADLIFDTINYSPCRSLA